MTDKPVSSGDLVDVAERLTLYLNELEESGIQVTPDGDGIALSTRKKVVVIQAGELTWEVWE